MVFPPRHDLFKQDPSSHLIWTSIDTLMGGAGAGNGGILVPISYTAYLLSYLSQNLLRLTRLLSAPRSLSQSLARRPQGCSIARTVDSSPQVVARPLAVPTNAISEVIEAVPLLGISHPLFDPGFSDFAACVAYEFVEPVAAVRIERREGADVAARSGLVVGHVQ